MDYCIARLVHDRERSWVRFQLPPFSENLLFQNLFVVSSLEKKDFKMITFAAPSGEAERLTLSFFLTGLLPRVVRHRRQGRLAVPGFEAQAVPDEGHEEDDGSARKRRF